MKVISLSCILVLAGLDLGMVYECISNCNSVNDYMIGIVCALSFIAISVLPIYVLIYELKD